MQKHNDQDQSNWLSPSTFAQTYFHGTKADLKIGDFVEVGMHSNYGQNKKAKYIYLTSTLDAAIWGAELAVGIGRERIYLIEPTGSIEDDPNLTNKKYAGNPTMSYRSKHPLRVVGEVSSWRGHPVEQVEAMRQGLGKLQAQSIEAIED
ncbi:MAG: NAD(+)--rifampin ADP-ribosyltransferase [Cyclobacteriaceae bacterium]